jgi:hypothetical protein
MNPMQNKIFFIHKVASPIIKKISIHINIKKIITNALILAKYLEDHNINFEYIFHGYYYKSFIKIKNKLKFWEFEIKNIYGYIGFFIKNNKNFSNTKNQTFSTFLMINNGGDLS